MINSVKQHHRTSHCHQQCITHLAPYYSPIISTPAFAPESPAPSEIAINYSPLPSRCFMVCSRLPSTHMYVVPQARPCTWSHRFR